VKNLAQGSRKRMLRIPLAALNRMLELCHKKSIAFIADVTFGLDEEVRRSWAANKGATA